MTTRKSTALAAILVATQIVFLSLLLFAHGNEQHVMGTVTRIDGMSITVKATNGASKTVMVMESTTFSKNGAPASQRDLKVGDRVVIHAKPAGETPHATEVRIGQEANAKATER
jgi:Domain of unknown function (DUF5666)